MSEDDQYYAERRRLDRTYVSKRFPSRKGKKLRIFNRTFGGKDGVSFATVKEDVVLKEMSSGRQAIKAVVLEDDRSIHRVTIQKFSDVSGPHAFKAVSFVGPEVRALVDFFLTINTVEFGSEEKIHFSDQDIREMALNEGQARSIFSRYRELFLKVAQSDRMAQDLFEVGRRRAQLEIFESLLASESTTEAGWQKFFEANRWIFGYGLSYQFLTGLDDGKPLERYVTGSDMMGPGKEVDAVMKTRGEINSLCYVEIKLHTDPLLKEEYRKGAWSPSVELASGVAQIQNTVHRAVERMNYRYRSDKTGEDLFNVEPRSCLVIGNLRDLKMGNRLDGDKIRSFELYRRNTWRPEVITYDELLERARFIVEHVADQSLSDASGFVDAPPFEDVPPDYEYIPEGPDDDDIPWD